MTNNKNYFEGKALFTKFYIIIDKIYALIRNCGKNHQYHATIFQLKNKEVILELILDLNDCDDITYVVLLNYYSNNFEVNTHISFNVVTFKEVEDNDKILHKILNNIIRDISYKKYKLKKYSLQKLKRLKLCRRWKDKFFGAIT